MADESKPSFPPPPPPSLPPSPPPPSPSPLLTKSLFASLSTFSKYFAAEPGEEEGEDEEETNDVGAETVSLLWVRVASSQVVGIVVFVFVVLVILGSSPVEILFSFSKLALL